MPRLSPEQIKARRSAIGSSDVSELLGISPYDGASPMRLFAEKCGLLPEEEEVETTEQKVGHALEGALVRLYESESGFRVIDSGGLVETVRHPRHPWWLANLDGRIVGKSASLEVKVVGIGMAQDWDLTVDDGIPNYVRVQCASQAACAELEEVHTVALIGGTGFRVFYVPRDLELEALIEKEVVTFWERVKANTPPPLDASSASRDYLNQKYPAPPADVEVEAPTDVIPIGDKRIRLFNTIKKATEALGICNNELVEAMGKAGATVMWCPSWKAIYRADKNGNRPLLVKARGELKEPRSKPPKANALRPPVVPRDLELEALIEKEVVTFWERVKANTPPPLDASSASRDYLNQKYPAPPADVEVEAPTDVIPIGVDDGEAF